MEYVRAYARLTNDRSEQVSEKLEKQIKKDPAGIDYNEFFRNAFYGVSYTDYLFSLAVLKSVIYVGMKPFGRCN